MEKEKRYSVILRGLVCYHPQKYGLGNTVRYRICILLILVIYMTLCDLHLHSTFTSFYLHVIHFVLCLRLSMSLAFSKCL